MAKNKINYGIQNVYYAPVTETQDAQTGEWTVTYGTPVPMTGARSIELSARNENVQFAADNNPDYFVQNIFNGYEGNLVLAKLDDDFRVACLGQTKDTNDLVGESLDDQPKPFALLFQFEGDQNQTRHVLYRVIAGQPDISSSTRENTIEPNEISVPITAGGAVDSRKVKCKCDSTNATQYAAWFSSVYTG